MLLILLLVELIVSVLVVIALLIACGALWGGPSPRGPGHW